MKEKKHHKHSGTLIIQVIILVILSTLATNLGYSMGYAPTGILGKIIDK